MKIGIAGAGIMGRLLALSLVNSGHHVSLFDKDDETGAMSCSMAAAGMLAPVAELITSGRLIYDLGIDALNTHWPLVMQLLSHEIYFKKAGSLVVSHPRDQAELTHFISMIDSKLQAQSIYQKLNNDELIALEPDLAKFQEVYYLPAEGQVDNQSLMHALHKALKQKNVEWYGSTQVTAIESNKIVTENSVNSFDKVFDCRGLGAASVFDDLQAVRGELIWLHAPDVNIQRPIRFMHPRYNLYIAPRPENIFIIGASEIYAEDYSEISVRSSLELLTAAYYLHPAFAEARILKTVTHCRPAFSDHMPKIKCTENSIAINGLYRHGYLIAPTLVAEIINWMEHGISSLQYPQLWEFS